MPSDRRSGVEDLIAEFDQEMASTRKMLERIPEEKLAWKPHEKSFTLGKMANHVASLPVGIVFVLNGRGSGPSQAASTSELLELFDKRTREAHEALAGVNESQMAQRITVNPGVTQTRGAALRWMMSHLIHHRGQLSVYLRLLNVPVPGMYGASADEN